MQGHELGPVEGDEVVQLERLPGLTGARVAVRIGGGVEREWCDVDVLRRLRRRSLAALRKEVEPAEQAAFGRFLPHWHGIDRRATLREALVPLQGLSLPVSLWTSVAVPMAVFSVPVVRLKRASVPSAVLSPA